MVNREDSLPEKGIKMRREDMEGVKEFNRKWDINRSNHWMTAIISNQGTITIKMDNTSKKADIERNSPLEGNRDSKETTMGMWDNREDLELGKVLPGYA